jgi:hypothetical protein
MADKVQEALNKSTKLATVECREGRGGKPPFLTLS